MAVAEVTASAKVRRNENCILSLTVNLNEGRKFFESLKAVEFYLINYKYSKMRFHNDPSHIIGKPSSSWLALDITKTSFVPQYTASYCIELTGISNLCHNTTFKSDAKKYNSSCNGKFEITELSRVLSSGTDQSFIVCSSEQPMMGCELSIHVLIPQLSFDDTPELKFSFADSSN